MLHLLKQTCTHTPFIGYDKETNARYGEAVQNVPCRWIDKDYTSDEVEGVTRQIHALVTAHNSNNFKADDKLSYNGVDYVVWRKRTKVNGAGAVLFSTYEVYREDTTKKR